MQAVDVDLGLELSKPAAVRFRSSGLLEGCTNFCSMEDGACLLDIVV